MTEGNEEGGSKGKQKAYKKYIGIKELKAYLNNDIVNLFLQSIKYSTNPNECFPWIGRTKPDGIAFLLMEGKDYILELNAQKFLYLLLYSVFPERIFTSCRNPLCINPRHITLDPPD